MMLPKGLGPRSGLSRLAPILLATGLAAGCQSVERTAQPAVEAAQDDGWQVVERSGDARYRAPAGGWSPTLPAIRLPEGSRVATGAGGRLILARQGEHVIAGPASRFSLPVAAPGAPLEQRAGSLRYRVAGATPGGFVVVTPLLGIEGASAVFDVTVSTAATEVSVQQGRVRIDTPDGLRHVELSAGQSAYAGAAAGESLAFRRAAGAPLEPVEALVLPAMQPRPGAHQSRAAMPTRAADYAGSQASTSGSAASSAAVPIGTAEVTLIAAAAPANPGPGRPAAQVPARADGMVSTGVPAVRAPPAAVRPVGEARNTPPPSEAARSAVARQGPGDRMPDDPQPTAFDRLSEGMVHGVPGARAASHRATDARRSF